MMKKERAALNRFQRGAYSSPFVCAVRTQPFEYIYIYFISGAQVRAHAVAHTCNHNYVDNDFPASRTEMCRNYDVHCSACELLGL